MNGSHQLASGSTRRHWFQFRLRMLLIAVAALAVPMAWGGYSLDWIRQRRAVCEDGRVAVTTCDFAPRAPGGLWLFGERGASDVLYKPDFPNAEQLQRLYPEAKLTKSAFWCICR